MIGKSTVAQLQGADSFSAKYDEFMDGSRPQELLECIIRDYCDHVEEHGDDKVTQVVEKACDLVAGGNVADKNQDPFSRVNAQWPARIREKAAMYDGPWKEEKNITEFMKSHAELKDCESTHPHPVSVSIILKYVKEIHLCRHLRFSN